MEEGEGKATQKEIFAARVEQAVKDVLELVEMEFIRVGEGYGFEQILPNPMSWPIVLEETRREIIEIVGSRLGVDLINVPEDQVIRRYREEGVMGQPSEGGADVIVLKTNEPQLTIHVFEYVNPDLGTRYDFVREA